MSTSDLKMTTGPKGELCDADIIGDAKAEHRMGRNFFKGPRGDIANAVLAAAGYNFRRLLAWLAALWRVLVAAWLKADQDEPTAVNLPI